MRKLFKTIATLMFLLIFTISSCKKNKQEGFEEIKNTNSRLQLLKWTSWNSVSNEEQVPTVFTYDEQGHIKTLSRGGYSYTPTYTSDKLTKLKAIGQLEES